MEEIIIVTVDHDMTNSRITLDTYTCMSPPMDNDVDHYPPGREREQYEYDTLRYDSIQFNSIQFDSRCRLLIT